MLLLTLGRVSIRMHTSLNTMLTGSRTKPRMAKSVIATKSTVHPNRVPHRPQQFAALHLQRIINMPMVLKGMVTTTRAKNAAPTTRLDPRSAPITPMTPL